MVITKEGYKEYHPSLFPHKQGIMPQVVVPFLHVFTGIFCILAKKFFSEVLEHDVSSDIQIQTQTKTRSKIEELSMEVNSNEETRKF